MYHHPIYPNPVSYLSWTIPMYPKWKCFPCFYVCPKSVIPQMVLLKNDRFCHSRHKSLQWFPSTLKKKKKKNKEKEKQKKTKLLSSLEDFPILHMLSSYLSDTIFYSPCSLCLTPTVPLPSAQSVSSIAQSCPTLCNPMNHSTPGLPVHHQLPEFTQTNAHQVSDAIQPPNPLSSPSPLALNPSQHQGLSQRVNSSHEVAKVLEFQLQHQSFQWTPRTDLL